VVKLYVEGGGYGKALQIECRRGFREFLEKAGLKGKMPAIAACGGRRFAYEDYCTAIANGKAAMLLVDSEAPIAAAHQTGKPDEWLPWQHLKARQGDGWDRPPGAREADCHLMVQCMESWFLADRQKLKDFFGQGFLDNALPSAAIPVETIAKTAVLDSLKNATRHCQPKGQYGKGDHSFKLLAQLDPAKVVAASPWAKRFVDILKQKMGA
jgi:hypothetical protein